MPESERRQTDPVLSLASCQTAVLVCDRQGQIRWANAAVRDLLACAEGDLVTMNVGQAFGPESRTLSGAIDIVRGAGSLRGEIDLTGADRRVHHFDLLVLSDTMTDPTAVQVIMTDVPEHQRLERAARQRAGDRAITLGHLAEGYERVQDIKKERAFLSSIRHDVQISTEAVKGYIELLAAELQRPSEPLVQIHTRMTRLSIMVSDLAELAAAGSEERLLRLEDVDVEDSIEEAASALYTEALRKQQRLIVDIADEASVVRADRRMLRSVLVRLLARAVRATPAGGTVTVSARRTNGSSLISVSDSALPIEDEDLPHVFRPFAKLHSDALFGDAAPGPALPLAKQLVELQGGSIWVERPADGGNAFCFSLPQ